MIIYKNTSKGLDIISNCNTHLFKIILNRWKTRCHHQHGQCVSRDNNITEHVLFSKVRQFYEESEKLNANSKRQYFNVSLSNILQQPTKALKEWITRTKSFFKKFIQQIISVSATQV